LLDSVRQTIQVDNQLKISFPESLMTFEIRFLGCGNEARRRVYVWDSSGLTRSVNVIAGKWKVKIICHGSLHLDY
jgi:hypothetical protein